jgi:hypothetical protein
MAHQDRYIEAKTNEGWGFASLIILLAIACIGMATYIHNTTYKSPNDVTFKARGERGK